MLSLTTYATNGLLPFAAFVEYRENGVWVSGAKGSSVEWLMDVVREDLEIFRDVRVVSQYGTVLQRFSR